MLQSGTIVAGYRIDGVLGVGGMGIVYRATQLSLNRVVALKLLAAELSDDPGFRARFRREGQLQAALDHEYIVTVFEAGQTEHGLFLAMRLIDGPTLKDVILGGQLEPRRALRLLAQVAQALDEAHSAGLIHRDIKPQNILIGRDDHAYLADFGLIKAPDDADHLTGTGQFVGTIDYVAPEQVQGDPATAASDSYALSAVLYECLTGQVPFPSPNEVATLHAHMTRPPPRASDQRPGIPPAVDEVIIAGMAKDPAGRPASATELIRDATRAFAGWTPQTANAAQQTRLAPLPGDRARSETTRAPVAGAAVAARTAPAAVPAGAEPTRPGPATVGASAAAADLAPARRAGQGAWLGALAGVVIVAAAIVVGFLVGHSGSKAAAPKFTSFASSGHLQLRYPATWQPTTSAAALPGMTFTDSMALAPSAGGGALSAGEVDAGGPTLLPAGFRAQITGSLPAGKPVQVGSAQALRYTGLHINGLPGTVTVYAAPTSAGVATLACQAGANAPASFADECAQVAATLRLVGVSTYPLGPSAAYAKTLSSALSALNTSTAPALTQLRAATTPAAQASAARRLATDYATAAAKLGGAFTPTVRDANRAIVAALRAVSAGYTHAAAASASNNSAAYARAGQEIRRGSAALAANVKALGPLGYSVSS